MFMKKFKIYISLSAILAAVAIMGCEGVLSGTFIVEHMFRDVDPSNAMYTYKLDVSDETAWEEHKDEIKNLDDIGFQLWMRGPAGDSVTVYVDDYADTYTEPADVQDNSTPILTGLVIPAGGELYIDWPTSQAHVQNLDVLKNYGLEGQFSIFALISDPAVYIDSVNVIITVTY